MFRQLDSSNTREHEGVELGLYLVRTLAELIGVRISVESTPGQGAVFTVGLPVGDDDVTATVASPATPTVM